MEIVTWMLSIQLWTEAVGPNPPPAIQLIYNKEYTTHAECMQEREKWDRTRFKAFCLMKVKK